MGGWSGRPLGGDFGRSWSQVQNRQSFSFGDEALTAAPRFFYAACLSVKRRRRAASLREWTSNFFETRLALSRY